jgi:hypothetical protein
MAGDQIDRKEEAKREKSAGREHHSGPAKPVAEIAPERPGLRWSWSVRHHGNYLQLGSKVTLKQPGKCQFTNKVAISSAVQKRFIAHSRALGAEFKCLFFK